MVSRKKLILCILDGFGVNTDSTNRHGDATANATFIQELFIKYKHNFALLEASEQFVGLPEGQFGNSEVGHMTIGSGRVIKQKLDIINESISSKSIEQSKILKNFCSTTNTMHIMGLFSAGGVHSHMGHILWAIDYCKRHDMRFWLHLFLDGRDVAYNSALKDIDDSITAGTIDCNTIATIQGRFFAMDRDNNIDRTQCAYDAIKYAKGHKCSNFLEAIRTHYSNNIYDEQINPIVNTKYNGAHDWNGENFWMLNYRTDRIKQILRLIQQSNSVLNMVNCDSNIDENAAILFPEKAIDNTIGEIIATHNMKQLRVAETEKYAHVTYFFSGGRELKFNGEDRILIPSPKANDYSIYPCMSGRAIADTIIKEAQRAHYDLIVVNFANPDMIGHTGSYDATLQAISSIDEYMRDIYNNLGEYSMIISADHGNAECMFTDNGSINKAHTCNPVPFVFIGKDATLINRDYYTIADIAPTILEFFNIKQCAEFTGKPILSFY